MKSAFEIDAEDPLLQGEDPPSDGRLVRLFKSLLRAQQSPVTPPTFTGPLVGAQSPPAVHVHTQKPGWSCTAVVVVGILVLLLVILGLLYGLTANGLWAKAETVGTTVASFVTRYAAVQHHHRVEAYYNSAGASVQASSTAVLGRVTGSVDLASLRLDWDVHVVDTHNQLGGTAGVALWIQIYNTTTHLLQHVAHSPLVLCQNIPVSKASCTGSMDHPAMEFVGTDVDPRELTLAVYKGGTVSVSNLVWIVPIVNTYN